MLPVMLKTFSPYFFCCEFLVTTSVSYTKMNTFGIENHTDCKNTVVECDSDRKSNTYLSASVLKLSKSMNGRTTICLTVVLI